MLDTTCCEAGNVATMKTQRQSPRLALRVSAVEATRWCLLGFQVEDDSQDHVERCAEQILQIDNAADCAGSMDLSCIKCEKRVLVTDNVYPYSCIV